MRLLILVCLCGPWSTESEFLATIRRTQVGVEVASESKPDRVVRFQATVIEQDGTDLTHATAGHAIADFGEAPWRAVVKHGDRTFPGRVRSWIYNPAYEPERPDAVPGADNAILELRLAPADDLSNEALKAIGVANVIAEQTPEPAGQTVLIWTIDQFGEAHRLRAGNYSNPKWLEWGRIYEPVPGDSGSGVFMAIPDSQGKLRPTLTGVVVDRAMVGGGASLVTRSTWPRPPRPRPEP
jgi:hypothetical protein